ncbi:MAG: beta-hydroxyacyl-ACP dehydratase [Gemmataceae bacterium]|nr:beta-hydroxyacyl-ACP dehydratase [Gemmataceae bacterium]MDW8241904.1 3-hydroxyacyl-ACP dehydratase FabZ family protein [Thermogemmata sp.]
MRWTWIDRFVRLEPGRRATAVKNLSWAEDYFADHFPGYPVMPAPLILEGLAQTGGILVGHVHQYRKNVILAKMTARFHAEAHPGQQITYTVELLDLNEAGARVRGTATVHDKLLAEADIMFAHVGPEQLPAELADPQFVFSGELAHLLRQAESVISASSSSPPSAVTS